VKNYITKILLFTTLTLLSIGCSVTKNLDSKSLILRSNKIYINNSKSSIDSLLISAQLFKSSLENSDSIFDSWLSKTKKREKKLNSFFSAKQVNQIKKF